ncbi:MAG: hypothetical protein K2G55_07025 [Lachnospiraceae bacterium]|nr:hypothetical protein [Lachnospiraceae bacterium]MDE7200859.1 hypothetical protein [Lachnospiraceae bacterium]
MEEQEYEIKGTVEGIIKVLRNDFDMPLDEARFFVYNMLTQHNRDIVDKEEMDAWYLSEGDKYEGQISNTHLVINFTNAKKGLYHTAYIFFAKYFFLRGIDLTLIGADLVYIVGSAIRKLADTDYCVYARIIELCMENKNRYFKEDDIVTANSHGKCDYREENWKCTYLGSDDACTCNAEKVQISFNSLEKQNIIQKVGERWQLVR